MYSNHSLTTRLIITSLILVVICSITNGNPLTVRGKPVVSGTWNGENVKYIAGEINVLFRDINIDAGEIVRSIDGKLMRDVDTFGFASIEVDIDADIPALCQQLYDSDPRIEIAEPNLYRTIGEWNPNDHYYDNGAQWALRNTGTVPAYSAPDADINTNYAWDYTRGDADVVLAILDTGIDMDTISYTLRHDDLNQPGKIILGPDCYGDGHSVADFNGHGTHVAGIAAAETNNSTGIAGVAGDCKILVIQVFSATGAGGTTELTSAINYCTSYQNTHPSERVVINYSGGGYGTSGTVLTALQNANTAGIPFVTASHNFDSSACTYPCQYSSDVENVICVGASDPWDERSGYSNYCSDLCVIAPGGYGGSSSNDDIWSCYPPNTYTYIPGTSMATPHVTGVCGLVLAENFTMTPGNLRTLIENTADDEVGTLADDPQGFDNKHGWGRVNAWSAVNHTYSMPYMKLNQRFSNTHSSPSQEKYYRIFSPPTNRWEIVAIRPHLGLDLDVQWIDDDGFSVLTTSGFGSDEVDFVMAHGRTLPAPVEYARIYNYSGTGKFSAEYDQADTAFIGTMYVRGYSWESSHVVQLYQIYLQDNHRYTFNVDIAGGEVDVGMALVGPALWSNYYINRSAAVIDIDNNGPGVYEVTSHTITTGDGWYALVIYSTNGRNGTMDIKVKELLESVDPIVQQEQDNVVVNDGYYYEFFSSGSTQGVIGVRSNPGNDYNLTLYDNDSYFWDDIVTSSYGLPVVVDFILYDRETVTPAWYYAKAAIQSIVPGSSGHTIYTEEVDEYLVPGTNGPYYMDTGMVVNAWDISLEAGREYNFLMDLLGFPFDLGFGIYRHNYDFTTRGTFYQTADSYGPGENEGFVWTCPESGDYTVAVWSNIAESGWFFLHIHDRPNLVTTTLPGWDYEFVPRDAPGATEENCHITATLPGNTSNTYCNISGYNFSTIPTTVDTFWNALLLDDELAYLSPCTTPLPGGGTFTEMNFLLGSAVRGGKHTIIYWIDATDAVDEINEDDNFAVHQFNWSPLELEHEVPTIRTAPPAYSAMFPQPNCDGFQFNSSPDYAYGIGMCPLTNTDYDLYLYNDYSGSESGFDSLQTLSGLGDGVTDFCVATYTGTADNIYPGAFDWTTTGTSPYIIEAIDARDRNLDPTIYETVIDTLSAFQILNVYESYLVAGIDYTIMMLDMTGLANFDLALYGPNYGYYPRSVYTAISAGPGVYEVLRYTPTVTGWYVYVVYKPDYLQIPLENRYQLSIGETRPDLSFIVTEGWTNPIVPRHSAGATPANCQLTDTLPGNTNQTYLNFFSYNLGPLDITDTYWNYIYIDGVSHYGTQAINPHPANQHSMHQNRLSSNVIRGGRHTAMVSVDENDDILESLEYNNQWSYQFVWSPYILTNNVPVTRSAPPCLGTRLYPNCDGFEFDIDRWGAVGIVPQDALDNFDIRLHNRWTDSENGFDTVLKQSSWTAGESDFVIANYLTPITHTYNVSVVQNESTFNTGDFTIQQANEQATWTTPGTYGPFTLDADDVMSLWEVYLNSPGTYNFEVDVVSGTDNIGTSLYDGSESYHNKFDFVSGGFSNSAPGGGDESFTIENPTGGTYFAWTVWKYGSADINGITFYLTWGPEIPPIPMPVTDLVIKRIGATTARLTWSQVTEDTTGSPLSVNYYRIHRNLDPNFVPSPADSIGYTEAPDTTYDDVNALCNYDKYFYQVIAVDTDAEVASQPDGEETRRIITGRPPRADIPEAVRERSKH